MWKLLVIALLLIVLVGVIHTFIYTARWEKAHPPTGSFKTIDGHKIHYLDIVGPPLRPGGEALPTVVLIHGASANFLDMKMAMGDRLSERRRVILVDRPGHGYSERPDDGYKLDIQTALVHGLLEEIGAGNPVIIGQSYGGAFTLRYALNYPDDISGLMLLAGVSHPWPGGVASHYEIGSKNGLGTLLRWTLFPYLGATKGPEYSASTFWPLEPPEDYHNRAAIGMLFRPQEFKNNAQDIAHLLDEVKEMEPYYRQISVPVKILTGTHDTTVSPTIHARTLSTQIPNSHFEFVPNTGHTLQHSATKEIDAMLAELDADIYKLNHPAPPTMNIDIGEQ